MAKDPNEQAENTALPERIRIGKNIRSLRDWRNLTQEDVEEVTGLDVVQLSRIENAAANVGIDSFIRLARGLNVPLYWLFTEEWPRFLDADNPSHSGGGGGGGTSPWERHGNAREDL